jgi:thioester reductase-like protein
MDTIHHNGAFVHHSFPYLALAPINVDGTRGIIRLACEGRPKTLHHISTFSVYPRGQGALLKDVPSKPPGLTGGYSQSKWVAERLVTQARERGINAGIYRFGRIAPATTDGYANKDDLLIMMLTACLHLGKVVDGGNLVRLIPVDQLARGLVSLANQPVEPIHNLVPNEPLSLTTLLDILENRGYNLEKVDYPAWREALLKASQSHKGSHFTKLAALLPERSSAGRPTLPNIETSDADQSASWQTPIDEKILNRWLDWLIEQGIVPAPG